MEQKSGNESRKSRKKLLKQYSPVVIYISRLDVMKLYELKIRHI